MVANAAATHTQRWALAMAETGHDVRVFSVRHHRIDGVDVDAVLPRDVVVVPRVPLAVAYTRFRLTLGRKLTAFRPDIVHTHFASTNGYIAARTTTMPTILTVWGSDVVPRPGRSLSPLKRLRDRIAIEHASIVTSASPFMARHVEAIVPGASVEIVPFGVDLKLFSPTPRPNNHHLIVAKSLEPRYGIAYVIEAMASVVSSVPDATLTVAGDGSLRRKLERLANNSPADIRFIGKVDHDDLPKYMADAAIVINPTIVEESFGVVVLEAQAIGRPVISTRVGAVPDVCVEGGTALLVPPRDPDAMAQAIVAVLTGTRLSEAATLGPRFVTDSFSWEASVAKMDTLYRTAADA